MRRRTSAGRSGLVGCAGLVGLAGLAAVMLLIACSSGGTVKPNDALSTDPIAANGQPYRALTANEALDQRRPLLRRIAAELAPGSALEDFGLTDTECNGGAPGSIFVSWRISVEVPDGSGFDRLDDARLLFAAAGYTRGHENLDYETGPDILWLNQADDSQLHAIGYRGSPRLDLILDGPCGTRPP